MRLSELKINEQVNEIKIGEHTVEVKTYLPIENKIDLINVVITKSKDETTGLINKITADILFSYLVVKTYSNIELDIDELSKEYDILENNNIIDMVFKAIPEIEIKTLMDYLEIAIEQHNQLLLSSFGAIKYLTDSLETKLENIFSIIDNIDPKLVENIKSIIVEGQK